MIGLLDLGAVDTLGWVMLCCGEGAALRIVGF